MDNSTKPRMSDPSIQGRLLKAGIIGTLVVALCCFTPLLVGLLGIVGLGALTVYLDYILLPALGVFVVITAYAFTKTPRKSQECCTPSGNNSKE